MTAHLQNIFRSTLHLLYPHICSGCGSDLLKDDQLLCVRCLHQLPHTDFAALPGNPVEKNFWGRISITSAYSQFYFSKEFLIQQLIHRFKYKGDKKIGLFLGEMMGKTMIKSNRFNSIDALLPLPMFPGKERRRGYNQATILCNGISAAMNIPVLLDAVSRRQATETQTRKHRTERWENVRDSFTLSRENEISGRHLLLVDDVITTGATLEACGQVILEAAHVKLSIATLAYTGK